MRQPSTQLEVAPRAGRRVRASPRPPAAACGRVAGVRLSRRRCRRCWSSRPWSARRWSTASFSASIAPTRSPNAGSSSASAITRRCSATPDFWAAIGRTAYFAAFSLVGTTVIGMAMALVLNERFPGRGLLRSVVLVPWAMAPVSVGVLWSFIYAGNYGALTGLLNDLGLGQPRAAVARRRVPRAQPCGAHQCLEPGAADGADAAGGACNRCRQACTAPPCWMAPGRCRASSTSRCRG